MSVPYDAETIDGKGLVVYPGFIDLYSTAGQRAGVERSATGKGRPVDLAEAPLSSTPPDNRRGLTPEFEVAGALEITDALAEPRRRARLHRLPFRPWRGDRDRPECARELERPAAARGDRLGAGRAARQPRPADRAGDGCRAGGPPYARQPGPGRPAPGQFRRRGFGAPEAGENPYPRVLMGSIAHFRQAMLDSDHLQKLDAYYESHGGAHPPVDPALKALQAARSGKLPVWWEANTRDEIHRALDLAEEFGTTAVIVGGREAGKVADRLKSTNVPVVLRLNFPAEPKVPTEEEYQKKPRAERDEPLRVLAAPQGRMEKTGRHRSRAGQGRRFVRVLNRGNRADRLVPGRSPSAHHRRALG